jgi:hypothetical protein
METAASLPCVKPVAHQHSYCDGPTVTFMHSYGTVGHHVRKGARGWRPHNVTR